MDISSLIASFSNGTFTVTRTARGAMTRGRVATGVQSSVSITAAWHPAGGREFDGRALMRLPEGRRTTEARMLYTTTELYAGGQGATYEADVVSIDSRNWEVQMVATWRDAGSTRIGYECLVQAVGG